MKKTLLFILIVSLLGACTNDSEEDSIDNNKLKGHVTIYYNNEKIELKEIITTSFTHIDYDIHTHMEKKVSGISYYAFVDEHHYSSQNSLCLDISDDFSLTRVSFNYYKPNTKYSTSFTNYYKTYDEELVPFKFELSKDKNTIRGKFSGKLYNAVNIINIDSCIFHIEKAK